MEIRTIAIATAAVVAAAVAGVACNAKKDGPRFETAKVERGKLVARVTATGTLSALVTVQVGTQVSGRIKELHVDFNSEVKKGQLLARIDPEMFQATVEQARASLIVAEANAERARVVYANAKKQAERTSELFLRKLIAEADRDTATADADSARASVAAAEAQVVQARAMLNQANVNLQYTAIHSPVAGVVISRAIDVGQTVAASLQAPTLFTIAEDLRKMQVDTSVAESDIGRIRAGMSATFLVDAYPNEKFSGVVRQIRNAPVTTQGVVTYDTVIDVDNSEMKLKPGMTANVTFTYAERDDTLKVPNAVLRFRPPQASGRRPPPAGERVVYTQHEGELTAVPIKTGISDGTVTEIVSGEVKEGDLLVTDMKESNAPAAGGPPMGGGPRRMF